jgi:hypothetical protein
MLSNRSGFKVSNRTLLYAKMNILKLFSKSLTLLLSRPRTLIGQPFAGRTCLDACWDKLAVLELLLARFGDLRDKS